jgi:hypothetical protein
MAAAWGKYNPGMTNDVRRLMASSFSLISPSAVLIREIVIPHRWTLAMILIQSKLSWPLGRAVSLIVECKKSDLEEVGFRCPERWVMGAAPMTQLQDHSNLLQPVR